MKLTRYLFITLLMLGIAQATTAKSVEKTAYIFGFAASFNDSTVYFTDIQEVKGAFMQEKTKFLVNRDEYSSQLHKYLENQGNKYMTCVTCYAFDRKDAQKKYDKMMKKYTVKAKNRFIIKEIKSPDFVYEGVTPDDDTEKIYDKKAVKEARKRAKMLAKEKKRAAKEQMRKEKRERMRPMGPPPTGGEPGERR